MIYPAVLSYFAGAHCCCSRMPQRPLDRCLFVGIGAMEAVCFVGAVGEPLRILYGSLMDLGGQRCDARLLRCVVAVKAISQPV